MQRRVFLSTILGALITPALPKLKPEPAHPEMMGAETKLTFIPDSERCRVTPLTLGDRLVIDKGMNGLPAGTLQAQGDLRVRAIDVTSVEDRDGYRRFMPGPMTGTLSLTVDTDRGVIKYLCAFDQIKDDQMEFIIIRMMPVSMV